MQTAAARSMKSRPANCAQGKAGKPPTKTFAWLLRPRGACPSKWPGSIKAKARREQLEEAGMHRNLLLRPAREAAMIARRAMRPRRLRRLRRIVAET